MSEVLASNACPETHIGRSDTDEEQEGQVNLADHRAPLDLIVRNGRIFDPGSGLDLVSDIGVRLGRIVAIGADLPQRASQVTYPPHLGTQVIDATGLLVTPGFIDLHAHVYTGVCPLTVPADETSSRSGVTTVVSAGDAGANTIEGFRQLVVERNRTRVLAFLHISTIGLAGWPVGESVQLDMLDRDRALRAIAEHPDIIVGIKVRETAPDVVGQNGLEPLRRALDVGREADLPVMCHIGNTPEVLTSVLDMLRPGDILTHCFTGSANNLVNEGTLVQGAKEAYQRGVIFDIGHGFGSYDFTVAEIAVAEGIWPTTISTDIHSLSAASAMKDLPLTMSKLLSLGMSLENVIDAVTRKPAEAIHRQSDLGSIAVGRVADLTLVEIGHADVLCMDAYGNQRTLSNQVLVRGTIRAGLPWGGPYPHPAVSFAVRAL
jgi:dihydroorotase